MNADAIRLNDIVTMERIDAGGSMAMSIASTPITRVVQRAIRVCRGRRPVGQKPDGSTDEEDSHEDHGDDGGAAGLLGRSRLRSGLVA